MNPLSKTAKESRSCALLGKQATCRLTSCWSKIGVCAWLKDESWSGRARDSVWADGESGVHEGKGESWLRTSCRVDPVGQYSWLERRSAALWSDEPPHGQA
ncbi:hypothetical protein PI125_g4731 [Phytophthora idaei]|nr:hypothetical protein PI125_g4731 [Phytophthora idaei]